MTILGPLLVGERREGIQAAGPTSGCHSGEDAGEHRHDQERDQRPCRYHGPEPLVAQRHGHEGGEPQADDDA